MPSPAPPDTSAPISFVRSSKAATRCAPSVHANNRRGLEGVACEFVDGDVLDRPSLTRAFGGCERVFHLAARISIAPGDEEAVARRQRRRHAQRRRGLPEEAHVGRLVHFSSIHALSPTPHDVAIDETRALDLVAAHAALRPLARPPASARCRPASPRGLDAIIVNPTAILGPHDYGPSAMGRVLLDLYHRRLPALVDGGFDWVDVRDVVAGALAAADKAPTGARYLLSGARRTVAELAAVVQGVTGVRPPRLVSPMWLARVGAPFATAWARLAGNEPLFTRHSLHALRNHQLVSHDKASRELGYTPRPLVDTITAAYDSFRNSGALAT